MTTPAKDFPKTVVIGQPQEEEINWLQNCALGEVKNTQVLNNIFYLLQDEGFHCDTKYVGGFKVLLQCDSKESMLKLLSDGKATLETWFDWIYPLEMEKT